MNDLPTPYAANFDDNIAFLRATVTPLLILNDADIDFLVGATKLVMQDPALYDERINRRVAAIRHRLCPLGNP